MDSKGYKFDRPLKKYRWGMLAAPVPAPADATSRSTSGASYGDASSKGAAQWEDLDHAQTLCLGNSGATTIVYRKPNLDCAVLRSCSETQYTSEKKALVELSRTQSNLHLLSTKWIFSHSKRLYVGSELSDMSLADIIDCTISLEENHIKTILNQVTCQTVNNKSNGDFSAGGTSSSIPSCM